MYFHSVLQQKQVQYSKMFWMSKLEFVWQIRFFHEISLWKWVSVVVKFIAFIFCFSPAFLCYFNILCFNISLVALLWGESAL